MALPMSYIYFSLVSLSFRLFHLAIPPHFLIPINNGRRDGGAGRSKMDGKPILEMEHILNVTARARAAVALYGN